jgi:hypothetical protein
MSPSGNNSRLSSHDMLVELEQLKNGLLEQACGGAMATADYQRLRSLFLFDPVLRTRLPHFLEACRTVGEFWTFIKGKYAHYQERRDYLAKEFNPLLDDLEAGRWPVSGVRIGAPVTSADPSSHEFIVQQIEKCDGKLASGDYDGAITNARALLEAVLHEMERRLSTVEQGTEGDLVKLFRRVQRLLHLDPADAELETPLKQVLSGLSSIVAGLAGLRNVMSDAHARKYRPQQHHARLAVNAANTLADFLFETFEYQRAAGRLDGGVSPAS